LSDKGEDNKESFKNLLTEDFSRISLLLERVKLPRVSIRRSWEIPIAWSTWSGKSAPTCDKAIASLLGSKSVDGLRLTQALWSKSENFLRSTSHARGTTEHFLSAAGSLLQERGDNFSELKSFLLQVDQAIGISQLLLMGTLGISQRSCPTKEKTTKSLLKTY
jgi:hypothetical protein